MALVFSSAAVAATVATQPAVKSIRNLQLKDGHFIIAPGLKIEAKYQNKFINNKINTNKINCLLFCIFFIGFFSLMDQSLQI